MKILTSPSIKLGVDFESLSSNSDYCASILQFLLRAGSRPFPEASLDIVSRELQSSYARVLTASGLVLACSMMTRESMRS